MARCIRCPPGVIVRCRVWPPAVNQVEFHPYYPQVHSTGTANRKTPTEPHPKGVQQIKRCPRGPGAPPQVALRKYCEQHGIVVQAYASLGGQDAGASPTRALRDRLADMAVHCHCCAMSWDLYC